MRQPNEKGTQKYLALYRIETSKSDIKAAEILLAAKEFRGANNRAYYGIYHAILLCMRWMVMRIKDIKMLWRISIRIM